MGVWFSLLASFFDFDLTPSLPPPPPLRELDPERLFSEAVQIAARERQMEEIRERASTSMASARISSAASSSEHRPVTRSMTTISRARLVATRSNTRKRLNPRLVNAGDSSSTSSSSEDDDSASDNDSVQNGETRQRRRRNYENPWIIGDSELLQKSYTALQADLKLRCGCACGRREEEGDEGGGCECVAPISKVLRSVQLGGRMYAAYRNEAVVANLPGAIRACLCNRFRPNRRKVAEKLRTKTFCCYFLHEGKTLLTASQDSIIRFYERSGPRQAYKKSREEVTVPYVGWSILDLVVSPDGNSLAYCTWGDAIHQGRLPHSDDPDQTIDWTPFVFNTENSRFAIFSLRFSYDGSELLAGGSDHNVYVFDRERGTAVLSLSAHDDDVNAVCFGDTASFLLYSGGDDGLVKVWDRRTMSESPVGIFAGHRDGITFIDARGDDRYLLSNCKDQTIKLWDLRCFSSTQTETHRAVVNQHWDYRWQCVPRSVRHDEKLPGDSSVVTMRGHSVIHTLVRARFSPESTGKRFIYTGCARGECVVYDMLAGEVAFRLPGHKSVVRDCVWNGYQNEIVTSSWDGETAVWRFDERVLRNLCPEGGERGDEDSCDEFYRPIVHKKARKRPCLRPSQRQSSTSSVLSQLGPMRASSYRPRPFPDPLSLPSRRRSLQQEKTDDDED